MKNAFALTGATAFLAVALFTYFKTNDINDKPLSASHGEIAGSAPLSRATNAPNSQGGQLAQLESTLDKQRKEIDLLRQQLTKISQQIARLQSQPRRGKLAKNSQSPAPNYPPRTTVSERFNNGGELSINSAASVDIEDVVYANLPTNADAPMTDCNGSVCKIYTFGNDPEATNRDFVSNLSKNLTSDVNVFFVEEQGQQVIYVESVQ